ncbi:MAG TPA: hypothetical protein VNZ05_05265 [Solirubrobacteraceae bacterium]|nr:hypothetical protein [Solirubrobacteraceae bacterium]
MFHVQVRQFPHNYRRFNVTEEELRPIAEAWTRGEWLKLGDRNWNAHQAKLTVIEAPRIPSEQLSMGRGWNHAQRHGEDVTQRVLVKARSAPGGEQGSSTTARASAPPAPAGGASGVAAPAVPADLLGGGARAEALLAAWRETASRFPERSPSECLALAERLLEVSAEDFAR